MLADAGDLRPTSKVAVDDQLIERRVLVDALHREPRANNVSARVRRHSSAGESRGIAHVAFEAVSAAKVVKGTPHKRCTPVRGVIPLVPLAVAVVHVDDHKLAGRRGGDESAQCACLLGGVLPELDCEALERPGSLWIRPIEPLIGRHAATEPERVGCRRVRCSWPPAQRSAH